MSSPSDNSVPGPGRTREIAAPVPVVHEDGRLPNRTPPNGRRRKRRPKPRAKDSARAPRPEATSAEPAPPTRNDQDEHAVDTLA